MIEDCIVNANVAETGPARMGGKTLPEPTEEKGSTNPKCETGKIWIGSPDYEVEVEDGMRIVDREGVVNDMKNGDCIATADTDTDTDIGTGIGTPALQAVMRLWLGRGEGNYKVISKIEKKSASPIGKRTPVSFKSPKPSLRKVKKTSSVSKSKRMEIKSDQQVNSMVKWWEKRAAIESAKI
jgi:hypothetical protein